MHKICLNLPRLLEGADSTETADVEATAAAPIREQSALTMAALDTARARARARARNQTRGGPLRCAPLIRGPRFKDNAQLSLPPPPPPPPQTETIHSPVAAKDPPFIMKKTATERCPKNYVVDRKDKLKCIYVGPRTRKRSVVADAPTLPLTEKATKGRNTKTRKTRPS